VTTETAARRQTTLDRLEEETFDLLIVGGGITGCGAAREAARRGLSVAVVDQSDIASGTSSRSSKLVHGGVRYLEQLEFSLVFESVSERRVLQDIAPHLVKPLPFLFPIYSWSRRGPWTIDMGLWIYDALSLFRSHKRHRSMKPAAVQEEEPSLLADELKGASLYYDCGTDDARLTLETVLDAVGCGAAVSTYTRVLELVRQEGRVTGARVHDHLSGREFVVKARAVINATGPWTDRTRGADRRLLRPTKGVHVVFDRVRIPVNNANVIFHPTDGRVLFAIPWGDRVYFGTTDTDYDGEPADVRADKDDVQYCLDAANHYFPASNLTQADVISTWAGLRPLIVDEGAKNPSAVSREHEVVIDEDGLVTIAGGKLTTYRRMAVDVVEQAVSLLRLSGVRPEKKTSDTDDVPLPGGVDFPHSEEESQAFIAGLQEVAGEVLDVNGATHLFDVYGTQARQLAERIGEDVTLGKRMVPGRPERMVQVDWAVEVELAERLEDVLGRRTSIFLKSPCQGEHACEAVADRMAELLHWSAERRDDEVARYRAEVARSRAWKDDPIRAGASEPPTDSQLERILRTSKTVAILGASATEERAGYFVPAYLKEHGYRVLPVNPGRKGDELFGETIRGALADLEEPVQLVNVFRNSEAVAGHVEEILAMKPKPMGVWLQLDVRNDEAAATLRGAGIDVVQDRCTKAEHARLLT
jgi:glycerol-3-phosphate dehydrogenase